MTETILELDHRSCGSLDVSLFWNRETNGLFVQVIDWAEEDDFSVPVAPASALQAFHHPYAYAPPRRLAEPHLLDEIEAVEPSTA